MGETAISVPLDYTTDLKNDLTLSTLGLTGEELRDVLGQMPTISLEQPLGGSNTATQGKSLNTTTTTTNVGKSLTATTIEDVVSAEEPTATVRPHPILQRSLSRYVSTGEALPLSAHIPYYRDL